MGRAYSVGLLHGHHENFTRCPISWDVSGPEREAVILQHKPRREHKKRLLHMREVLADELPEPLASAITRERRAYDAWRRARVLAGAVELPVVGGVAGRKLRTWWRLLVVRRLKARADKLWERWSAEYQRRGSALATISPDDWEAWHETHCGAAKMGICKWTLSRPSIF